MKRFNLLLRTLVMPAFFVVFTSCEPEDSPDIPDKDNGKKVYNEANAEWFPGGKNGTVFMASSRAYRQPMPFIDAGAGYYTDFMRGERIFEKSFVTSEGMGYSGLGPVYIRKSCIACHPSYGGRSKRVDKFDTSDSRNGYLLMIYDPASPTLALASKYFTGMTQTRAVAPFKAPIDEAGIKLTWEPYTDEYGNKYADGTPYSAGTSYAGTLIYPKVEIAQSAILFPDFDMSKHAASLEATIGIYGVGLLDAISDDDLRTQYADEQTRGYAKGIIGGDIEEKDPSNPFPGVHPGRFTYLCTRGTLDNGPGSNAIWNITNVTRPERTYHYITDEYAKIMSQDVDVQKARGESKEEIYNYLMSNTLTPELTKADYDAFMVWHRSVAVPAARNLDDEKVQRGKTLFNETGCTACHKPSWKTRSNYTPMPELSNQTIYPYTDLLRHDLDMKEPGRVKVCRTTPLWGRGLMPVVSGYADMLHDLRARNYEEAILWHGGEAKRCKDDFRSMSKDDREALIAFLRSI
ncbi:putative thiol oxidoreductase [Bacteroidales bacterium Barb4]|nr:putative thiol oxidoreductase [Bacteroidales bacterium Barb4]